MGCCPLARPRVPRSDAARAGIAAFHAQLDKRLAETPHVADPAFTVADIATFIFLHAATTLGAPIPDTLAHLADWDARMRARPAIAKEVAETSAFVSGLFT